MNCSDLEMESLEKHPDFTPEIKLRDLEPETKVEPAPDASGDAHGDAPRERSCDQGEDESDLGLSLFQQAETETPKGCLYKIYNIFFF